MRNGNLFIINEIIKQIDVLKTIGQRYSKKDCFYINPCESSEINIYTVKDENLGPLEHIELADVDYKCRL